MKAIEQPTVYSPRHYPLFEPPYDPEHWRYDENGRAFRYNEDFGIQKKYVIIRYLANKKRKKEKAIREDMEHRLKTNQPSLYNQKR